MIRASFKDYRHVYMVPTYAMYLLAIRWRKHPWHGRPRLTFRQWCDGATPLLHHLSLMLTLHAWIMPLAAQILIRIWVE